MGSYSALKRQGILTQATTWMSVKDVMLSEIEGHKGQAQKDTHCMILLT